MFDNLTQTKMKCTFELSPRNGFDKRNKGSTCNLFKKNNCPHGFLIDSGLQAKKIQLLNKDPCH